MQPSSTHTRSRPVLFVALLGLANCNAYDASLLDAPRRLASIELDSCDGTEPLDERERCNGKDDDCDGVVDESAASDCDQQHARGSCVFGICEIDRCEEGFGDCNRSMHDGCEQAISTCDECSGKCTVAHAPSGTPVPITATQTARTNSDAGSGTGLEEHDLDGGPAPNMPTGPTTPPTRACEARGDCEAVEACAATRPTGQGSDCDHCACEACDRELRTCLRTTDNEWNSLCSALLHCYGSNVQNDACTGDCLGPCGDEYAASVSKGFLCSTENVVAPCGALRLLRVSCYQSKCAAACKG